MPDIQKPHWSFWFISILALLWHLGTVMNFFTQLSPEGIASLPERYRAIVETRPFWATAAFAVAGFSGLIGCLFLLLRHRLVLPFFWASFAGVVVTIIPALTVASGPVYASFAMSLGVIVALVWYARRAENLGLLR